jgi:alanine racemase
MFRPLVAHIDLEALHHNQRRVRTLAPWAKRLAVVKANAYGHGMLDCARALDSDTEGFALLSLEEARSLRGLGVTKPILLLEGVFKYEDYQAVCALNLTPVIHHAEQILMLELNPLDVPEQVFLKVDSGMHRLGFTPPQVMDAFRRLKVLKAMGRSIDVVLMTHYACADEPGLAAKQMAIMAELKSSNPELNELETSYANSAAVMAGSAFGKDHIVEIGDWIRTGLMLYGASPLAGFTASDLNLKPVMHLQSQLIAVRNAPAGEGVGYGMGFVPDRDTRIGVVACGYADGYPRHAPTGTPVVVNGTRTRLLGRVSMDMLCVDLSPCPEAGVGAPVELFGRHLPIDEVATAAATIPYELMTAIAHRVPRSLVYG